MTQPTADIRIRLATEADLPAIDGIYNPYVLTSTCTYQTDPTTPAERLAWFAGRGTKHPVTVAETGGDIVGWASISRFRERAAYDRTVENAVYVRASQHRLGIGSLLLADSVERARVAGHRAVIAVIDADQAGSIALHERHGFERCGYLKQVGYKFGRWLDVVYMQRLLA